MVRFSEIQKVVEGISWLQQNKMPEKRAVWANVLEELVQSFTKTKPTK